MSTVFGECAKHPGNNMVNCPWCAIDAQDDVIVKTGQYNPAFRSQESGVINMLNSGTVTRIVFHFNKAHNQDPGIPMWVLKHKGNTYNVDHVMSEIGFSTKETPDNPHTKGSIMFRGRLEINRHKDNKVYAIIR